MFTECFEVNKILVALVFLKVSVGKFVNFYNLSYAAY